MTEIKFKKWCARLSPPAQHQFEAGVKDTLTKLFTKWELGNPIELTVLKPGRCGCLEKGIAILTQHDRYMRGGLRVAISTQNSNQVLICRMQIKDIPLQKVDLSGDISPEDLSEFFKKDSLEEIIRRCQNDS